MLLYYQDTCLHIRIHINGTTKTVGINLVIKTGVVYKISCNDCSSVYAGQTDLSLKKCCYVHSLYVKNADERSVVAMHSINNSYQFD